MDSPGDHHSQDELKIGRADWTCSEERVRDDKTDCESRSDRQRW